MRKNYDGNKSKKAILIIVLILVVSFAIKFVMSKINESKTVKEDENIKAETEAEAEVETGNIEEVIPVIQIAPTDTDAAGDNGLSNESEDTKTEVLDDMANLETNPEEQFYTAEISDELFERMKGKSFKDDCTLDRSELRYVHVLHKNLQGETLEGELVVNYHIADDTLKIFREFYEADYPIEKIRLIDEYDADDERSMADNNSSSFNFRLVSRTTKISKHGYGLAIDINPLYNPYITTVDGRQNVEPANAGDYVDREADFDYKITHDDLAYEVFKKYGFAWGGDWKNSKDYQHFEIPSEKIKEWYPEE